jgi:zinc transporter 1/2/3
MLPEALERFDSPCLGSGWHSYHAFGGLFAMLASFALQVLELAALSNLDALARKQHANTNDGKVIESVATMNDSASALKVENHHEHNHTGIDTDGHVHTAGFLEHEQSVRNIGTLILEFGIVMHSIIIGITLGTTDNAEFNTLLIALVFHQVNKYIYISNYELLPF